MLDGKADYVYLEMPQITSGVVTTPFAGKKIKRRFNRDSINVKSLPVEIFQEESFIMLEHAAINKNALTPY